MVYKEGGFLLQVENSQEVIQLLGPDLAANLGNRVEVTGTASATPVSIKPASSVLEIASVSPRSTGGCLTVAALLNAQTSVPTAAPAKPAVSKPAASKPSL